MSQTIFQASGPAGRSECQPTPRKAAADFFNRFPTARKCRVWEFEVTDRGGLIRRYGIGAAGPTYQDFEDVTRKTAANLPD